MKRRYQIDQQRAVQAFRQLAREENPNLQMMFPLTEVVGLLQEGVDWIRAKARSEPGSLRLRTKASGRKEPSHDDYRV